MIDLTVDNFMAKHHEALHSLTSHQFLSILFLLLGQLISNVSKLASKYIRLGILGRNKVCCYLGLRVVIEDFC
jgi:hypothetical protein